MRRLLGFVLVALLAPAASAQEAPPADEALAGALERARASGALARVLGERAFIERTLDGRVVGAVTVTVLDLEGGGLRVTTHHQRLRDDDRYTATWELEGGRVARGELLQVQGPRRHERVVTRRELVLDVSYRNRDPVADYDVRGEHSISWRPGSIPCSLLYLLLGPLQDQGLAEWTRFSPFDDGPAAGGGRGWRFLRVAAAGDGAGLWLYDWNEFVRARAFTDPALGPPLPPPTAADHPCLVEVSPDGQVLRVRDPLFSAMDLQGVTLAERDRTLADPELRAADAALRAEAERARSEAMAMHTLRTIAEAQRRFAAVDRDGDGVLAAATSLRELGPTVATEVGLQPPVVLEGSDGSYRYGLHGDGQRWVAWAWPERPGESGVRLFVINDRNVIHECPREAAERASGFDIPAEATPIR